MEPLDFKFFCKTLKEIWKIKKRPIDKNNLNKYLNMKRVFEKSIVSKKFIKKGKTVTINDLDFKKPGNGIRSDNLKKILGKKVNKNIKNNVMLKLSDFYV